MQVKNIECQIAQAQLRRYLTGEEMPQPLVSDLESHLKNCNECMAAAQQQRESLSGVLASKIIGDTPAPLQITGKANAVIKKYTQKRDAKQAKVKAKTEPTHAAIQTPLDILDSPDSDFVTETKKKTAKKPTNIKTIAYSIGLGIVLVLMSTVFKNPTGIFGPKASANKQDTPPVESSEPEATNTELVTNEKITPPVTDENTEDGAEENTAETTDNHSEESVTTEKPVATKQPAKEPANNGNTVKIGKNDIIIADTDGASVEKPKPSKGNSIKVYPPAKK